MLMVQSCEIFRSFFKRFNFQGKDEPKIKILKAYLH